MMSEEDEISLVMKSDNSACCELGSLREERGQHATDPMSKHSIEVVKDKLWVGVAWGCSMADDTVS